MHMNASARRSVRDEFGEPSVACLENLIILPPLVDSLCLYHTEKCRRAGSEAGERNLIYCFFFYQAIRRAAKCWNCYQTVTIVCILDAIG
jgi:hypothetical protein